MSTARREVLLLASYCGGGNPRCTDAGPCVDCLAMSNVFEVDIDTAVYVRQLAPSRQESTAWECNLRGLPAPLAGARRPGRSPFHTLPRLAGASWPVGRRP